MPDRELVRIDDPRVVAIPIRECGDVLVDVRTRGLRVDESRSQIQRISAHPFLARASVIARLQSAQALLPVGIALEVKEAWRPIEVQAEIYEHHLRRLRKDQPQTAESDLRAEAAKYVAPPDIVPPHSTGGAVDLILVNDDGPLDMGWGFNEPGDRSAMMAGGLSPAALRNRATLTAAMECAGLVNYPHEWWHWSYGDRYWAWHVEATAIFGSL